MNKPASKPATATTDLKINDQKLLEVLRDSDVVKTAVADQKAQKLARRQHLVKERDLLIEVAEREFPLLQKAVQDAIAEADAARFAYGNGATDLAHANAAIIIAQAKAGAAQHKSLMVSLEFDARCNPIEAELKATADPAIAAPILGGMSPFVRELWDLREAVCKINPLMERAVRNPVTGAVTMAVNSNAPAIKAAFAAIHAAIDEANQLHLLADQEDIPRRLEVLRQSLPLGGLIPQKAAAL